MVRPPRIPTCVRMSRWKSKAPWQRKQSATPRPPNGIPSTSSGHCSSSFSEKARIPSKARLRSGFSNQGWRSQKRHLNSWIVLLSALPRYFSIIKDSAKYLKGRAPSPCLILKDVLWGLPHQPVSPRSGDLSAPGESHPRGWQCHHWQVGRGQVFGVSAFPCGPGSI